jgi:hypothetical protein
LPNYFKKNLEPKALSQDASVLIRGSSLQETPEERFMKTRLWFKIWPTNGMGYGLGLLADSEVDKES